MHATTGRPLIGVADPLRTRIEAIASYLRAHGFDVIDLDDLDDLDEAPAAGRRPAAIIIGTEDDGDALMIAEAHAADHPGVPIFVLPNSVGETPPSAGPIHGIAPATSMETFLALLRAAR